MNLKDLQANWDRLGRKNPFWAVLTCKKKWQVDDFLKTGEKEIKELLDEIKSLNGNPEKKRALDFGCGVGRLTQPIANYYEEVYGVDIAPSMIKKAIELNKWGNRCKYILNETDNLEIFEDDYFNLIYSNITLQHIEPRYSKKYIKEFIRILSPDGLLVFYLPSERKKERMYLEKMFRNLTSLLFNRGIIEMYVINKNDVIKLIEENNGNILLIKKSYSGGKFFNTLKYFIKKRN